LSVEVLLKVDTNKGGN